MQSVAMIFPGQGSQQIGALYELSKEDIIIQQTFEEASEYLNYNLWKFMQNGCIKNINQSQYIQPCILVSSVAIYRLWKKFGGFHPNITAGHSLGEYSALVCGNAIKFSDAVKFIKIRAKMMKECVNNQHVMMKAIIGLDENIVFNICKKHSNHNIVNLASINSHNQTVISGHKKSVKNTIIECKKMGAKCIVHLPINVPAHSNIMKKISKKILIKLKKISIKSPIYPILNSISVKKYMTQKNIRYNLMKQLYKTVQWKKTINVIQSTSKIVLEVGMGNILTNLNKKNTHCICMSINNPKTFFLALQLSQKK